MSRKANFYASTPPHPFCARPRAEARLTSHADCPPHRRWHTVWWPHREVPNRAVLTSPKSLTLPDDAALTPRVAPPTRAYVATVLPGCCPVERM
eukprot:364560-Chlamydomonas_euryale.AAC.13